jgi:uncharacterized protein involved in type VI secretion and phage assembly
MSVSGSNAFGKYRGKVVSNADQRQLGRLQVIVPDLFGDGRLAWAMPCVPYAGNGVGLFAIPPVGANVWVEFERGDPGFPIWSGCFWGQGEVPATPAVAEQTVLKTATATITVDDRPGSSGITIQTRTGQKIVVSANGIEIENGQGASIKLSGPRVAINGTALEVI